MKRPHSVSVVKLARRDMVSLPTCPGNLACGSRRGKCRPSTHASPMMQAKLCAGGNRSQRRCLHARRKQTTWSVKVGCGSCFGVRIAGGHRSHGSKFHSKKRDCVVATLVAALVLTGHRAELFRKSHQRGGGPDKSADHYMYNRPLCSAASWQQGIMQFMAFHFAELPDDIIGRMLSAGACDCRYIGQTAAAACGKYIAPWASGQRMQSQTQMTAGAVT